MSPDTPEIPDKPPPNDPRMQLFQEIVQEHKGKIEIRMKAIEEEKDDEEWDHANQRPRQVRVKTGKTIMSPTLVMVRVPMGERANLKGYLEYLVKSKLGEEIEIEHEVDPRAISKDRHLT